MTDTIQDGIAIALVVLVVWFLCGLVARAWLKGLQETETYWSDHDCCFNSVYRAPSKEMLRARTQAFLLGPLGLLILAIVTVDAV